jgi:hypothetical protein
MHLHLSLPNCVTICPQDSRDWALLRERTRIAWQVTLEQQREAVETTRWLADVRRECRTGPQ